MFWTMFFAMLAALAVMDVFHFGISFYFTKKQEREMSRVQKEMEAQGIDPNSAAMFAGMGLPVMSAEGLPPEVPKADDADSPNVGQYL